TTTLEPYIQTKGLSLIQAQFAALTLIGAILTALYSLLQFFSAPIWGKLSDKLGRKPLLLFTIGGNLFSYLIWAFADSFSLLVISRLLAGLFAGNISIASAYVAD